MRHFVLIHAPWEVLAERAEYTKLKVPLQVDDTVFTSWLEFLLGSKTVTAIKKINPLVIRDSSIQETPDHFMAHFKRDRLAAYTFQQNCNQESFFSTIDRQYLIQQIFNSTRFCDEPDDVGFPLDPTDLGRDLTLFSASVLRMTEITEICQRIFWLGETNCSLQIMQ